MGGWGTGARLLLHWLGEEADAAYGPCELGEDQWGCRKGAGYQAQAALRRAVASILAIWRARAFREGLIHNGSGELLRTMARHHGQNPPP